MDGIYEKKLSPEQIAASFNELARRAGKPDRWEVKDGDVVRKTVQADAYAIISSEAPKE